MSAIPYFLKLLLIFTPIIVITSVIFHYFQMDTMLIPYPYKLQYEISPPAEAKNAHILILGDRMASSLNNHILKLQNMTYKKIKDPLRFFDWSSKNEGIHRTLHKLKSLKKLPPIIIYFGASSEFYEYKYLFKEYKIILNNFKKYEDSNFIISFFPFTSRFFYKSISILPINTNIDQDTQNYKIPDIRNKILVESKLFNYKLQELLNYIKDKNRATILITTPINLELPPKTDCPKENNEISKKFLELDKIQKIIDKGNLKVAYEELLTVEAQSTGDASVLYMLGSVALKLRKVDYAQKQLKLASIYDCKLWRGNFIFNTIIMREGKKSGAHIIDFDQITNNKLGLDTIFLNDIYPQEIYYDELINQISKKIINILKI